MFGGGPRGVRRLGTFGAEKRELKGANSSQYAVPQGSADIHPSLKIRLKMKKNLQ